MVGGGELGQGHLKGAAAALVGSDLLGERGEDGAKLFSWLVAAGGRGGIEPLAVEAVGALDVGGDEVVLGGEEPIQRRGRHRSLGGAGGSAGSGDVSNAISAYMIRSETAVRESGLSWTILRPAAFMSNALRWAPQLAAGDVVRLPFAGVQTATVDPYDIAAVAAAALLGDGHGGRIYQPTGPESLLPAQQVAFLAAVLGRELRFQAQPDAETREQMSKNTPAEYIDAFFDFYVTGSLDESQVRDTVEQVTGTTPRTFHQWATAHADAFR